MTPSDRQGAGADEGLLAAVAEALASHGAPSRQRPSDLAFRVAADALAAAGRVLAERLREERERLRGTYAIENIDYCADLIAECCGLPPEGAGGGGDE